MKAVRKNKKHSTRTLNHSQELSSVLHNLGIKKITSPRRRVCEFIIKNIHNKRHFTALRDPSLQGVESYQNGMKTTGRVMLIASLYSDDASSRIGIAKEYGLVTPTYEWFTTQYNKAYPDAPITIFTWKYHFRKLVKARYVNSDRFSEFEGYDEENNRPIIRSKASRKWFTDAFYRAVNFSAEWHREQRGKALKRLSSSGLSNVWLQAKSTFGVMCQHATITLQRIESGITELFDVMPKSRRFDASGYPQVE